MTILEQNLSVLKTRDPEVFERIVAPAAPSADLEFLSASTGDLTARREGLYLNSPRDPRLEAERFFRNWNKPLPQILIMEGFALGYHAEYYIQNYTEGYLWIIEPDIALFLQVLSHRDLRTLLGNPRVILFFRPRPEELALTASGTEYKELGVVKIRSVYAKDQEYYEAVDEALQAVMIRKTVNSNTLKRFGHLWVRNLFQNLTVLPRARGIIRLENCLEGFPAILLAAGPSLDEVLPVLPELQKRFVLIAVDTSYKAVLEAGVVPDFLVVVDPQYWNTRHLDGTDFSNMILISDSSTHPRIFRDPPPGMYFCQSHFPLGRFLEENTDIRGKISAGGSVATFAWETARITGTSPVFCAGLDLGFPDMQTHKKESYFEKLALIYSGRKEPQEKHSVEILYNADPLPVPNNRGTFTLTDRRMEVYTRWFETQLVRNRLPETFNLSPGGIAIRGMSSFPLKDLMNYPCRREEIEHRLAPFRQAPEKAAPSRDYLVRLVKLQDELSLLIKSSKRGLELTGLLEKSLRDGSDSGRILRELDEVDKEILKSSAGNIAGFLFQDLIYQLSHPDNAVPDPLENSRKLYGKLRSSGEFHLEILKRSLSILC